VRGSTHALLKGHQKYGDLRVSVRIKLERRLHHRPRAVPHALAAVHRAPNRHARGGPWGPPRVLVVLWFVVVGCYSLWVTAVASARRVVPVWIAVLWPDAAGSPILASRIGSMMMDRKPPQPSAAGAEKLLSTSLFSLKPMTVLPSCSSSKNSPSFPVIGLFGAGGLVVPSVRCSSRGLVSEPT
jgi:hypothetical protein